MKRRLSGSCGICGGVPLYLGGSFSYFPAICCEPREERKRKIPRHETHARKK